MLIHVDPTIQTIRSQLDLHFVLVHIALPVLSAVLGESTRRNVDKRCWLLKMSFRYHFALYLFYI